MERSFIDIITPVPGVIVGIIGVIIGIIGVIIGIIGISMNLDLTGYVEFKTGIRGVFDFLT